MLLVCLKVEGNFTAWMIWVLVIKDRGSKDWNMVCAQTVLTGGQRYRPFKMDAGYVN